jgi:AraC-like DNA-binding protein
VPETRRPRHFHSEPELNLITAGTAIFGAGDTTIPVGAGDLLWWSPGQDHVMLEASPDLELFVIGLAPELCARVLGSDGAAVYGGATRVTLDEAALARLRAHCSAPLASDAGAAEGHVGAFWQEANRLRLTVPSDKHTLTARALRSLIERPHLRRDDVASAARGYPSEVSRYFHRDLGLTLTEYRTRLRLIRFMHGVVVQRMSLLRAALEAGFGSYSQCHRVFQHTLGCTPRNYFQPQIRARMEDAFLPLARDLRHHPPAVGAR